MKKKGFTLIELLAVIVILAIIALIATPVVMNLIGKARQKSAEDSTYGIVKSTENYFAEEMLNNSESIQGKTFLLTSDGLCTEIVVNNKHTECLEINGTSPTGGRVEIDS